MHARITALFLALTLGVAGLAAAQETTGTISGRIVDPQGLAVPGATVTITGPQGMKTVVTDSKRVEPRPSMIRQLPATTGHSLTASKSRV